MPNSEKIYNLFQEQNLGLSVAYSVAYPSPP